MFITFNVFYCFLGAFLILLGILVGVALTDGKQWILDKIRDGLEEQTKEDRYYDVSE